LWRRKVRPAGIGEKCEVTRLGRGRGRVQSQAAQPCSLPSVLSVPVGKDVRRRRRLAIRKDRKTIQSEGLTIHLMLSTCTVHLPISYEKLEVQILMKDPKIPK
jgi:hypothetical protein